MTNEQKRINIDLAARLDKDSTKRVEQGINDLIAKAEDNPIHVKFDISQAVRGLNEVFKLMEEDKAGRTELWEKTNYLKDKLVAAGFDIGHSQSAVVPVMIYNEPVLFEMYQKLRERGVYVNIVTYPAVRRKECRLRLCTMKDLTFEQIDKAVDIIADLGREYGIIK